MPTPAQIETALGKITDQASFIKTLLVDTLGWPIDPKAQDVEDITYAWSKEELRAANLDEKVLGGTFPSAHMSSCGAGRTLTGIEANGDIKGCPSLPSGEYVGGNIRDNTLQDIWERTEALRFTRDRTEEELWGRCRSCYYATECMAGCTWTGHVLFGKRGNNPFCHHRSLELLRDGLRERLERVVHAEGRPFDHATFDLIEEPWPEHDLVAARARYGVKPRKLPKAQS